LGVEKAELDPLLLFATRPARSKLMKNTNQSELCEGLHDICVFRAAGEYLRMKLDSGTLTAEQLDALQPDALEFAVKQIKEGEVSTTFAVGDSKDPRESALAKLSALALWFGDYGADLFGQFRRMQW